MRNMRQHVVPKNKTQARHAYGDGRQNELPGTLPRKLSNVQSRIKGQIQHYKMMSKRAENKNLFNKEPKVYYKEHPGDMGYDHEPSIQDSREKV